MTSEVIYYPRTSTLYVSLQWRHNERDGVSNHQPRDCLLKCLFRYRSKKTSKLHVTGLCEGNSLVTGEFPTQRASNAETVSIWWRHHDRYFCFLGVSCMIGHWLMKPIYAFSKKVQCARNTKHSMDDIIQCCFITNYFSPRVQWTKNNILLPRLGSDVMSTMCGIFSWQSQAGILFIQACSQPNDYGSQ